MENDKREIVFQTESSIERKVLALLTFVMSLYAIFSSLQFTISYSLLSYPSWLTTTIVSAWISYSIMLVPLVIGLGLITGLFMRKIQIVKVTLLALGLYSLIMALLNGVAYVFQGTPFTAYLATGVISIILFVYYSERTNPPQDFTDRDLDIILPERNQDDDD